MPTTIQGRVYKHPLGDYLYGLSVVKPGILRSGKVMLAESEKSVLQSYSYYGENSFTLAVCGSSVSTVQRDTILKLGVSEVIIAFDKEYHVPYTPEADKYSAKLLRVAQMFAPYVRTCLLFDKWGLIGYKDAPTDRGR